VDRSEKKWKPCKINNVKWRKKKGTITQKEGRETQSSNIKNKNTSQEGAQAIVARKGRRGGDIGFKLPQKRRLRGIEKHKAWVRGKKERG